ncbi:hypothetical protein E2562_030253 [Oryza meyeriana var. granulata]|uniref:Uncharacterized protein n=1 Tax=Oryza meyeriana var. granulata TaxID=110450 RepID=A0A6G1D8A7_9ORYZ|nr:hypothetical protein E2562_030253 [Oryza meyeriana var. granulata]
MPLLTSSHRHGSGRPEEASLPLRRRTLAPHATLSLHGLLGHPHTSWPPPTGGKLSPAYSLPRLPDLHATRQPSISPSSRVAWSSLLAAIPCPFYAMPIRSGKRQIQPEGCWIRPKKHSIWLSCPLASLSFPRRKPAPMAAWRRSLEAWFRRNRKLDNKFKL